MSTWTSFRDSAVNAITGGGDLPNTDELAALAGSGLVSLGTAAAGNLTAAQVAAGQTGAPPHSNTLTAKVAAINWKSPMVIGAVLIAVFFVMKKGRK